MKKYIPVIISLLFLVFGFTIYLYSGLDQMLLNLVIFNVIVYFIRTISIRIISTFLKTKILKYLLVLLINLIWISFLFTLLFYFSPTFTITIVSFLIVAISLTFKDIISNIAAGAMIISSQIISPGDLVNISNVEGIVSEITLNHTKILEFDGVVTYIPNSAIYNASVIKYTHRELKTRKSLFQTQNNQPEMKKIKEYSEKIKRVIEGEKVLTSYVKVIEIIGSVDPNTLDSKFQKVFDKYEPVLGIRPTYNMNNSVADRYSVSLRINSRNTFKVFELADVFIRDILFEVNNKEVFLGWEEYKKEKGIINER